MCSMMFEMLRGISVLCCVVVGVVIVVVMLIIVFLVVLVGVVQELLNNGINFELFQWWNDNYKFGICCMLQGMWGVYVMVFCWWFKQIDGVSVENIIDIVMFVIYIVMVKCSEIIEVKGEIKVDGMLIIYFNQFYGFDYINMVLWELLQKVGFYDFVLYIQGCLVWGFIMLDVDVQNVSCGVDFIWYVVGKLFFGINFEFWYVELRFEGLIG